MTNVPRVDKTINRSLAETERVNVQRWAIHLMSLVWLFRSFKKRRTLSQKCILKGRVARRSQLIVVNQMIWLGIRLLCQTRRCVAVILRYYAMTGKAAFRLIAYVASVRAASQRQHCLLRRLGG